MNAHVLPAILLLLAAIGHVILWVALVNRAHALGIRHRSVTLLTVACVIMFAVMPVAVLAAFISVVTPEPTLRTNFFYAAACTYLVACAVVCVVAIFQRLWWRFHAERRGALVSNHTQRIDFADQIDEPILAPGLATLLNLIPGNQVSRVSVQDKLLSLPRLSHERAGLRIAHLSDLHMSGRMTRKFYERVVDETNHCKPDIIAITGDIADANQCLDWIPEVLGRLQAPAGVFYVLGNHDLRVNQDRLKMALAKTNWTHLAGDPISRTVGNLAVVLGGNERPWYGIPTDFTSISSPDDSDRPLRIALSHSPDQIGWACANEVDLMLAGHVHGGQVCLPVIGPFTAPSMLGVRYAGGTYRVGDTVMHVSRGTASLTPIRWNCPPEIAVLQLGAADSTR